MTVRSTGCSICSLAVTDAWLAGDGEEESEEEEEAEDEEGAIVAIGAEVDFDDAEDDEEDSASTRAFSFIIFNMFRKPLFLPGVRLAAIPAWFINAGSTF